MEKNINVKESVIHPSWNYGRNTQDWRNDIAILKLAEEVDLSKYTPACLPRPGENFVGKTALAMGMLFILAFGLLNSGTYWSRAFYILECCAHKRSYMKRYDLLGGPIIDSFRAWKPLGYPDL